MTTYTVTVAFEVEASSPAMAIRKLDNALGRTVGRDYLRAVEGTFPGARPFTSLDDPRLMLGAYEALDVTPLA